MNWFYDNSIRLIEFPAVSPDLNPIENIWAQMTNKIYRNGKNFKSAEELKNSIIEEWNHLNKQDIKNKTCRGEMENRMFDVMLYNGKRPPKKVKLFKYEISWS